MERLQKKISNLGYTSRRNAEKLILDGRVKVNDEIIDVLGYKVKESDKIKVDDVLLKNEEKVYYILNKPRGVVSTTNDEKGRKTITSLIPSDVRIYPVGRLDYDTTGLIILTNDGDLANKIMHPKNKIEKLYIAKIKGILYPNMIRALENGVILSGVKTAPCNVKVKKYDKITDTSIVQIIIHEGKNHQIKNMFASINVEVLKLKREMIGFLTLDGLNTGDYRRLNPKEVKQLYSFLNN